jgi:hypothetical protein
MKLGFAVFCDFYDIFAALFSFTGTDPGTHGVCADVAI